MASNPRALPIVTGALNDLSAALTTSGARLESAALNALDLLSLTGNAGATGDTADDLRIALAMHVHLLHEFSVTVRTADCTCAYHTHSATSFDAYASAAAQQGDTPCAITVTPAEPDRAALLRAHSILRIKGSLDDALMNGALATAIRRIARKPHYIPPEQRAKPLPASLPAPRPPSRVDIKKLAAHDL